MDEKIYRAIDANLNRALEGLRVVEDVFRFTGPRGKAAAMLKGIRHRLAKAAKVFPSGQLLSERDVPGDDEKFSDAEGENVRESVYDLARKNLHRAMEAVRSIEEFSKLALPDMDRNPFQEIRFSLYSLEKDICLPLLRAEKMNHFEKSLYAILDSAFLGSSRYVQIAMRLIEGGASIVQLRMKDAPTRDVLAVSRELAPLCRERDVLFIVNDHVDIALLSGADGVHLGQDDLPVSEARRILLPEMIIGLSTHSVDQAMRALEDGPDYIAIGPVYDTKSKNGEILEGIGEKAVGDVAEKADIPVVAIGGIDVAAVKSLAGSGCASFAVISYLYRDDRIEDNCGRIKGILKKEK